MFKKKENIYLTKTQELNSKIDDLSDKLINNFKQTNNRQSEANINLEQLIDKMEDLNTLNINFEKEQDEKNKLINALINILDLNDDIFTYLDETNDNSQVKLAYELIDKELTLLGIKIINDINVLIDHRYHYIEKIINDNAKPDLMVIKIIKKGYLYNGNIIRKASVIVNKRSEV